jgi:acetone carboxylase gamma subunit
VTSEQESWLTQVREYLAREQARVAWPERILLKLQEHVYLVDKDGQRVTKCTCGHEFGPADENWKHGTLVYDRDPKEIYPGATGPDKSWCVYREFICPGCATLLEVEAVPPGLPFLFAFEPDLDALAGT